MQKLLTIIGARPQIIKAAAISRAIKNSFSHKVSETIIHTGQHYDLNMSEVFFSELEIPKPDFNLGVGSGTHGKQTAAMIEGIEKLLIEGKPDYCLIYGDTNSTLAAAVAASKLHVPVIHVEAGLRSYNRKMPEEINRVVSDHLSTLLFAPTDTGFNNLVKEGFNNTNQFPFSAEYPGIFKSGDIMLDNSLFFSTKTPELSGITEKLGLDKNKFVLATIHRSENTDDINKLDLIFRALYQISHQYNLPIVLPLHPRTKKIYQEKLASNHLKQFPKNEKIRIVEPVSFLDMIELEKNTELIMTDSGGVQKEAYFFEKPCVILREETEWVEIVEQGMAIVAGSDFERITLAYSKLKEKKNSDFPGIFGNGKASEFILESIVRNNN